MKRIKDLRPDATPVQMVMGNSEHDGTKNLHPALINSDRVKYFMRNMDDYDTHMCIFAVKSLAASCSLAPTEYRIKISIKNWSSDPVLMFIPAPNHVYHDTCLRCTKKHQKNIGVPLLQNRSLHAIPLPEPSSESDSAQKTGLVTMLLHSSPPNNMYLVMLSHIAI